MSYFTPGGSNLMTSPYAPRMGETQRKEFSSHINPDREVPDWIKAQSTNAEAEAEELVLLEEWEAQQEPQDAGFSCPGPWEDPLACMDGPCETRPFWQHDDIEYAILTKCLAQRKYETEKERAEAEAEYVAEYHAWVLEMAQAGLAIECG